MSKEKLSSIQIATRLTIICFIAAFLLAIANLLTAGKIASNSKIEEDIANKFLFSDATSFSDRIYFESLSEKEKKNFYFFKAMDSNNETIGYIVYTQGSGFGGAMKIAFSTDKDFKILKVKLMDNSETPGYGKKYEKEKNVKLFSGTNTSDKTIPDSLAMLSQEDKDTVTTATISFKGIAAGLKKGVMLLKKEVR